MPNPKPKYQNKVVFSIINSALLKIIKEVMEIKMVCFGPIQSSTQAKHMAPNPAVMLMPMPTTISY
jgi:hypothetical protein